METPKGRERQAACRRPDLIPREEAPLKRGAVAVGGKTLEGTKAQGRIGPSAGACAGTATDFRGGQSPEGGRGPVESSATGPFEPTPGGLVRPEGADRAAEGETFEGRNPKSVIDLKQGRGGFGRRKASRRRETSKAPHTRARQTRERSLPDAVSAEGIRTLERRDRREAVHKLGTVILRRGAEVQEGFANISHDCVAAADDGKPTADRVKPVQVRGGRRTDTCATVIRGNP
jgi:hypothetical protein